MDPRMDPQPRTGDQPHPPHCYRHPERATGLRCSRCGQPICGECAVPAPVGQLCPDDAEDRPKVRRVTGAGRGLPVVTWSLLAINTVLLLVEVALSGNGIGGLIEPSTRALCRLGALNAPAVIEDGQYWRLLTVMVLHAGIIHWAFNSYALFIFGPTLEALLGRVRFLVLYIGCGFAASGASLLISHTQLGVGASGAIFGLLGALVAFFYRRRDVGGRGALQNLLLVLALNLFIGARVANVDNVAHIGGFLAGLLAMGLLEAMPERLGGLGARGFGASGGGNRRLFQGLALAVPFLAGVALVVAAFGTVPTGPTCAGV
jgi:membrane associated rhomboid family serine protease